MAKINVNGREYDMPDEFTLGELADMEEITGQGYDMTRPGVRGMIALAYIAIRRKDPRVTLEDVRNMGLDDIEAVEDEEQEVPPPPPPPDESGGNDSKTNGYSSSGSDVLPAESRNATGAPV